MSSSSSDDSCSPEGLFSRLSNQQQKTQLQRFFNDDPSSTVLDMRQSYLRDSGAKIVAEKLKTTTSVIKELSVRRCFLSAEGITYLLEACEKVDSSIEVIDFSFNSVGDTLATRIGILRLKTISLCGCFIGNAGLKGLAHGLMHNTSSVEKIDISYNSYVRIGCEGMKSFGSMLKVNKSLKEVIIHSCNLKSEEVEVLVDGVECNTTLEVIDLEQNYICFHGATALKRMVQNNGSLKKIDLSICDLSFASIKRIIEGLKLNYDSSLQDISFRQNEFDVDCVKSIGALIKMNRRIKVLNLHNTMGLAGMKVIAEGLQYNTSVEEIDLGGNWRYEGESESDYDDSGDDESDEDGSGGVAIDGSRRHDDVITSMANMLQANRTLKVLKIKKDYDQQWYTISTKVWKHFIGCLLHNSIIECIESDGICVEDDAGVVLLTNLIKTHPNLREIRVTLIEENISKNRKKELIDAIRQHYNLEKFWSSDHDGDFGLYREEIDLLLERNRRGLGRCLVGKQSEERCVNVNTIGAPPAGVWPHIFSKLGCNMLREINMLRNNNGSSSNCLIIEDDSNNIIMEASLLYFMIREKPDLFNNVACDDNTWSEDNKNDDNGNHNQQKRQRLE